MIERLRPHEHDDAGMAMITAILVCTVVLFLSITAVGLSDHSFSSQRVDRKRVQTFHDAQPRADVGRFEAAARHESYTRAAQELALTQGAVSRQISLLEEFLGVALFRRTRHGVLLTGRGAEYLHQIGPRLQGLEQDTFYYLIKNYGILYAGQLIKNC